MKICIASVALSLFFGASASAKGWNSRILSIYESFDDERRSLRGNTAKDKSYLEREEENILKEEEALLESILERGRRNSDDDDDEGDDDEDDRNRTSDSDDRNRKSDNYLGCFQDEEEPERDLPHEVFPSGYLTVNVCKRACRKRNKKYAGIQSQTQCFCGNDYGRYGKTASSNCFVREQRGGATGGNYANSIYKA
mmetsp:Transcript_9957/g.11360  ORF Transcript_9957/g.11360 Transcript_9957/m.11360 type:complete len:196 (-) Transcript_9957:102-689(-)